ncbi:hypothetical protein ACF0H5_020793 [Mactra antiquata]
MKLTNLCVHGACNLRVFIVVLGGFLVHLAIGGGYVLGNFAPYFISYIRNRTDDTAVKNVDALWVTSIGTVGNMFGLSVGGLLAYKFGPKTAIFIGCIIFSTSVALSYFSVDVSYITVVLTYGLMAHFGDAITYGTSIQTAIKWLPNHATLAAGIIASGTGLGSVIYNPIVTGFINPDNLPPEFTDTDDEKYAYGQTFIYDDHFLTLVGTLAAVFNCGGRPLWGIVMDRVSFKISLACITVGFSAVTGTLFLTEDLAKEWFLAWICSIYFFYSGIWAIMPSALAKLLGPKHMSVNYGLIASGSCLANILGSTMATTLKSEIGWQGLFFLASGMSGVVFIASFFFNGVGRDGAKI